jgi:hypothetical protein
VDVALKCRNYNLTQQSGKQQHTMASSLLSNLYVQVGLLSLGTMYALEAMKPDLLYDKRSGQPKNELLTPVSIGVFVGVAWLLYKRRMGGSTFGAQCVRGMNLSELDGYVPGPDQGPILPPDTFSE